LAERGGSVPLVVTGARGRIGRLLARAWALQVPGRPVLWSARAGGDLPWDIGRGRPPALPEGALVLDLAAVISADPASVAVNAAMAEEVAGAARAAGARALLVASTLAVHPAGGPFAEDSPPAPLRPYGAAKLAAEGAARAAAGPVPVTVLRIGNVVGADALLSPATLPVRLDPVEGQAGGPLRSWIGPRTLARALATLVDRAAGGGLPATLNLAQDPPLAMAAMLDAAGLPWIWGPPRRGVVGRATLDLARLAPLVPLPPATPAALIADWRSLP
jgi:nucleoside-diphosphate-sugar epimerase